ncbi:MAG: 2-oxoacid:acceptor oxidoreductase subunit alpha, partial [Candidatus Marsarchaeota archaeon]|nr:2-oxoacid:acceptor oxidoreductase subunit alpha [Candidatus Marsarchaeota archaeon]
TDEHDEWGHDLSDVLAGLREAVVTRKLMHEKRMRKLESLRKEMRRPNLYGRDIADLTLLAWGSTALPVREALEALWSKGYRVNALEFEDVYPLNPEVDNILKQCSDLMAIEQNYTGQFANLIRRETGVEVKKRYLKYDGEPIYPAEIVNAVVEYYGDEKVKQLA